MKNNNSKRYAIAGFVGLIYAAVFVIWQVLGSSKDSDPTSIIISPGKILQTLMQKRTQFSVNVLVTIEEAGLGLLYGIVAALVLSVIIDRFRIFGDGLYRLSIIVNAIPLIALISPLVAWLGVGFTSKVIVAALSSYFPMVVNLTSTLRTQDPRIAQLATVLSMGYFTRLIKMRLPASLPAFFSSLRIAAPAAIVAAIIAEWMGAERGLGAMLLSAMFGFMVPEMWAILVISAVLNGAVVLGVRILIRLVCPWWLALSSAE
jgi:ABC-type nitrate/sulfonate/bicarbonate transport system permease component